VLQNQYWDLKVSETGFEVGLSFDGQHEVLAIPFSALKGFFDPSVQFALRFDVSEDAPAETTPPPDAPEPDDEKSAEKVVSLDSFRKKP
jgi:hypothetical protein